jgi:hypothetical protein
MYTNEEGKYTISVAPSTPITVRFDTHSTLINAQEWHPSVVANVDAQQDVLLDRFLLGVGFGGVGTDIIDALAAYQFCAAWIYHDENPGNRDSNRAYAKCAASRLQQDKWDSWLGEAIRRKLQEFFEQAQIS